MKKFLLLLLFVLLSAAINAQDNNHEGDAKFIYCEIVGTGRLLSNRVTIEIDLGQATSFFESSKLRDDQGKKIVFNSMVDAMNYMGNDGWEFTQAYVVTIGQQNVYHWLLKKDIQSFTDEEREDIVNSYNTSRN